MRTKGGNYITFLRDFFVSRDTTVISLVIWYSRVIHLLWYDFDRKGHYSVICASVIIVVRDTTCN